MELRPFGTLTLQLAPDRLFFLGDTPVGKRVIQEFEDVRYGWVDIVPVVGKGVVRDGGGAYDFFEMV